MQVATCKSLRLIILHLNRLMRGSIYENNFICCFTGNHDSADYRIEYIIRFSAAIGKILSPQDGFSLNAESVNKDFSEELHLNALKGNASVYFDERMVPHVLRKMKKIFISSKGTYTRNSGYGKWNSNHAPQGGCLLSLVWDQIAQS